MRRKIAVLVCAALAASLSAQALTYDEALAYVLAYPEEAAADIVRLDAIEAAVPALGWGPVALVFLGEFTYSIGFPALTIQIADLSYRVTFPPQVVELAIPAPPPPLPLVEIAAAAGLGFLVGVLVGAFAF